MSVELRKFNSPIFGETREATELEKECVGFLVDDIPVTVFGILNKKLNSLGMCISILQKEELK